MSTSNTPAPAAAPTTAPAPNTSVVWSPADGAYVATDGSQWRPKGWTRVAAPAPAAPAAPPATPAPAAPQIDHLTVYENLQKNPRTAWQAGGYLAQHKASIYRAIEQRRAGGK